MKEARLSDRTWRQKPPSYRLPGYQRTDTSLLGGKPVSAAARSFRAAGYFLKKEKKRSGFRIQQGKNSDMKNLQKEKRDVAR